jgi:8-oxo-dGTP pyrophosphatase MutT (NUDIX family)
MVEYVLVLPLRWGEYDPSAGENILVVHKEKPQLQKGRINLVGGKIELGETPEQAAYRELQEESGLKMMSKASDELGGPVVCGRVFGKDCVIYCVRCNVIAYDSEGVEMPLSPREGEIEKVEWLSFSELKNDPRLMPNLKIIIPLLMMDSRGWTIGDENTSFNNSLHEIKISLEVNKHE